MYNKKGDLKTIIKNRWIYMPFVAGLFLVMVVSFSSPCAAKDQDVLTVVMHAPPKVLDPHNNTALTAQINGYLIYDTLFAEDENYEIRPQMVDSWKVSNDQHTYTFTLRKGLHWHDGKPVTSSDCIASIRRWASRDSIGQLLMKATADLKIVNDKTFQILLKEPFGLVLYALGKTSSPKSFMMPKRVAETPVDQPIKDFTGSGPFIFVNEEFKSGLQAVYVKNATYVPRNEPASGLAGGKLALVNRIVWRTFSGKTATIDGLRSGEIDYLEILPHELVQEVKSDQSIVVEVLNTAGRQGMIRMNWLQPPFDNPKLRKAVGYAVNQIDFLRATYGDPTYYRVCKSAYTCSSPLTTNAGTERLMEGNLAIAKTLLKEGGYDGTTVIIMNPKDVSYLAPFAMVTAHALRKIGMNVEIQDITWGVLAKRRGNPGPVSEGGWHIFPTSWPRDNVSNPLINRPLAASGRDSAWFGWPEDKKITALIADYPKAPNIAEQKRIAAQIQIRAYEVGTHYVVGEFLTPSAFRRNIRGVLKAPTPVFWNLKKD